MGTGAPLPSRRPERRTAVGARRYTARNAALKRRMLANPAANAIADIGIDVPSISAFARWTRRVMAAAVGDAPACRPKSLRKCREVIPSVSARRIAPCA
jgi:hypothetical protein